MNLENLVPRDHIVRADLEQALHVALKVRGHLALAKINAGHSGTSMGNAATKSFDLLEATIKTIQRALEGPTT